jgi:hypothetical protein
MSNTKISALTSATTPLAGTETLPVVQSGATTKVSVANLTAGRSVNALSLTSTNDISVNGITVGLGASSVGSNTVLGNGALASNTTGLRTVAIGVSALNNNTTGNSNVAIGYNAMRVNISGQSNSAIGSNYNYAAALGAITSGSFNAALGEGALGSNQTGNYNVACGILALNTTTASNNTAVGYNSGSAVSSGDNNVILGSYTGSASPISATGSNYIVFSDGSANVRGYYDNAGNLIFPVAAKGVNFTANTPASGMTTQLLNWYEEGTWTPADGSGAGLTFTSVTGKYTRIGRQVTATAVLTYPITASVSQAAISGLPFAVSNMGEFFGIRTGNVGANNGLVSAGSTTIILYAQSGAVQTNANNSASVMYLTGTYFV